MSSVSPAPTPSTSATEEVVSRLVFHMSFDDLFDVCVSLNLAISRDSRNKRALALLIVTHLSRRVVSLITDGLDPLIMNQVLESEYGQAFLASHTPIPLPSLAEPAPPAHSAAYFRVRRADIVSNESSKTLNRIAAIKESWPSVVPKDVALACCKSYYEATKYKTPEICASCSRQRLNLVMHEHTVPHELSPLPWLSLLSLPSSMAGFASDFIHDNPNLNAKMLHKAGIHSRITPSGPVDIVVLCHDCHLSLVIAQQPRIPRFSMRNNLYRGQPPAALQGLTWIEEMAIALFRNTAHVVRLYKTSTSKDPLVLHGNTCAFDMNVVSTATVLPRTPASVLGNLSIVFVGPGRPTESQLKALLTVRKDKVWEALLCLKEVNPLYFHLPISRANADLYGVDSVLPGAMQAIIIDNDTNPDAAYKEETAGFDEHPATYARQDGDSDAPFIEAMGVSDPEGVKIPGRTYIASALRTLLPDSGSSPQPDLILSRGSQPVKEYNNPLLFLGMFPTLYTRGIGGFEDPSRPVPLSFQKQAEYYLDLSDRSFRYHRYFMFVALNIIQRRTGHLYTYFTVKRSSFQSIAQRLVSLSPELIQTVASHLENEGRLADLSAQQQEVMNLLKQVNTIASHVPGSQASKLCDRNEIRAYMGYFNIAQIFLTLNLNAVNSPIFQVMFGDTSVDLGTRFPELAPASERARRLAQDPVAAADFFQFCINSFLEHMLGWDFEQGVSSERGGILGHVRAFYGSCEYYERGGLHGHFTIWLLGGLNPSDVHKRMQESPEFCAKFFAFFEDIIKHHLPDVEIAAPSDFEPRAQRPPLPISGIWDAEWDSIFHTEWKLLGEILQRHTCREVCHKFNHPDDCRFLFPHPVVKESFFDKETNSIVLLCLDGNINYHNPFILVFCRHNHDIKCILSGKAAKAAMFYITDYITKMDLSLHEMVSLLSRTVASLPPESSENMTLLEKSRILLHKCLSQFGRQQQIHAQQAVRYLRNLGDTVSSHKTQPMLSSALMVAARNQLRLALEDSNPEQSASSDIEHPTLKIMLSSDGTLNEANQVDDYLHRGPSLSEMCFYDFVRTIKKDRIQADFQHSDRGFPRHSITPPHKQHESHWLIQRADPSSLVYSGELVPRVLGTSIPRKESEQYPLFMLAHFKPWSHVSLLVPSASTAESEFCVFPFLPRHCEIMKNWEDLYECQDERDAERMRKQGQTTKESDVLTSAIFGNDGAQFDDELDHLDDVVARTQQDRVTLEVMEKLRCANWFTTLPIPQQTIDDIQAHENTLEVTTPSISIDDAQLNLWKTSYKAMENEIKQRRRVAASPAEASPILPDSVAETSNIVPIACDSETHAEAPPTISTTPLMADEVTEEEAINRVGSSHKLNQSQLDAFRIIARHFFRVFHAIRSAGDAKPDFLEPLRMLMTGPGGTGKTHVVRALQALMAEYGCAHYIRYLAPTGSAASLIDGMTIHSGLGIQIKRKNRGKGSRAPGADEEDWTIVLDAKRAAELREEWRHVYFLLVDEISLVGAELLCDLDHALRFVKESDAWFGGICVMFGGDFFQYAPVGSQPLYTPITSNLQTKSDEIRRRLGRLAWKKVDTVIILTEQMRMANDPEYGSAVRRLRERCCTQQDVDLFNSRVIQSPQNPSGIDMGTPENLDAAMIVVTNAVRFALNSGKARSNTNGGHTPTLVRSAAWDTASIGNLSLEVRRHLLNLNLTGPKLDKPLPGYILLYVGMPVILRDRNISTELKITNGSQGVIRRLVTQDRFDLTIVSCAIVYFPLCQICLPGLQQGEFPITPSSWSFTHKILMPSGESQTVRIKRQQLSIQPAFAVTGHSAQGKTLPKVLVDLREGGFAAYVAASRPTSRHGLCITDPVSLEDLNKPLPATLIAEHKRLQALAHNTLVVHGLSSSNLMSVPDPEFEQTLSDRHRNPSLSVEITSRKKNTPTVPQKHTQSDIVAPCTPKHARTIPVTSVPVSPLGQTASAALPEFQDSGSLSAVRLGPKWDSQNWSCAYDSVFVALFSMFKCGSVAWKNRYSDLSPLASFLINDIFDNDLLFTSSLPVAINAARNSFRDKLTSIDGRRFQRHGPVMCNIDHILAVLGNNNTRCPVSRTMRCVRPECDGAAVITGMTDFLAFHHVWLEVAGLNGWNPDATSASTLTWFKLLLSKAVPPPTQVMACPICSTGMQPLHPELMAPPPVLWLESTSETRPRVLTAPSLSLPSHSGNVSYRLSGIIYFGGAHFSLRFFDNAGVAWKYDGIHHEGRAICEQSLQIDSNHPMDLSTLDDGKTAAFYAYALDL